MKFPVLTHDDAHIPPSLSFPEYVAYIDFMLEQKDYDSILRQKALEERITAKFSCKEAVCSGKIKRCNADRPGKSLS
jgi:hypothetical protein